MKSKTLITGVLLLTLTGSMAACANTMRGATKDTEKATENTAAVVQTVDVKSALIADGRVDASQSIEQVGLVRHVEDARRKPDLLALEPPRPPCPVPALVALGEGLADHRPHVEHVADLQGDIATHDLELGLPRAYG